MRSRGDGLILIKYNILYEQDEETAGADEDGARWN